MLSPFFIRFQQKRNAQLCETPYKHSINIPGFGAEPHPKLRKNLYAHYSMKNIEKNVLTWNTVSHGRDISEYQVNEPAPTEEGVQNNFAQLLALAAHAPGTLAIMRKYIGQWTRWLRLGLSTIKAFETSDPMLLPSVSACWTPGARLFTSANCL
jgi:hypothetical protein